MANDFVKIDVEIEPDVTKISFALESWAKKIKDWRPVWSDVIKLFRSHEKKHLDSEGTTTGARFYRLDDLYADWKDEYYPSLPILQRSRVLYAALVEGGSGSLTVETKDEMTIGLDRSSSVGVYGRAHQEGKGRAYRDGKPARPPIRVNTDVTKRDSFGYAVTQIAQSHVVHARKQSFTGDTKNVIVDSRLVKSHHSAVNGIINRTWK